MKRLVAFGTALDDHRCRRMFRARYRDGRRTTGRTAGPWPNRTDTPPPLGTPGRGYALGGAHVLGIPYDEYIIAPARTGPRTGPADRRLSSGQVQGHTLERLFPGIGRLDDDLMPGIGLDGPSVGESVDVGAPDLIDAIREGGPGTVLGLSEGALVLNEVQLDSRTTPPPRLRIS